jgi:hypothetical protein
VTHINLTASSCINIKVKLFLCLTKHHAMKAYLWSGGIAPRILDLGTSWSWVVSFTARPIYPPGKSPWYSLDRKLGGPQSRSGHGREKVFSLPMSGIEPRLWLHAQKSHERMGEERSEIGWYIRTQYCRQGSLFVSYLISQLGAINLYVRPWETTCLLSLNLGQMFQSYSLKRNQAV